MNVAQPSTTVHLRLPPAWIEVDPRVPDLLPQLVAAIGLPEHLDHIAAPLLRPLAVDLARAAERTEVLSAGFFAQAIEVDGSAEPLVLTANLLLAVSPTVDHGTAVAALGPDVEPVDLPAGPAVLATGEVEITDERWDGSVTARTRRYLVPVPGTDRVAVLHFQTPNLDLAEQFDDVFAAIAESLSFETSKDGAPT